MALLLLGRSLSVGGANLGPAPRDGAGGGDVVGGDQTPWEGSELAGAQIINSLLPNSDLN